ncbi:MAG TPA: PAS domain S-box protein [Enhygromyxa sp.]|nr:PAS domain S-box protein [Enhygromyxa sp.]
MSSPPANDETTTELERLQLEVNRLARENAELRAREILDEQLDSDAARYQVIVANLEEGVVLQVPGGQILTCNAAAERILGLSVEQMAGRSSTDPRWRSIHEDGSPFPGETHPAMVSLRTGEPLREVIMGVHKPDGSLTWISINSQPLRAPGSDRPYAVVTSFSDVTRHKQAEARARDSEERLRFALQAASMGTWDWDVAGGKVSWSDDIEAMFGLDPGSFAGTYEAYLELVHREDRDEFEVAIARALANEGGDDFVLEHRLLCPDGVTRWAMSFGRVLRDERGDPLRFAGTIRDISDSKLLEQQLLLSQRMETVGRLAGGVAHDFNNLLTAILGCADLVMARPNLDLEAHDALETIREASERAAGLTRQLLSFARKQVFDLAVFDLRELIANTERLLSRVLGEHIQIGASLGSSEVLIRADRAQIEQVLINLAVNARDAMPRGGSLAIELGVVTLDSAAPSSLAPGRYALLELRDSGQGISKAALPHIFEPFFTTKQGGTGLGLATCYGIVKQLGGEIEVDSEPGRGTRFSILLPIASGTVDKARVRVHPTPAPAKGRILLAEDNPVVRMIAERGLQAHGYEVFAAADGPAALELFDRLPGEVDLLISDIMMPSMTGYELAEQLHRKQPALKVLFVSGYDESALDRAHAGAAYLPKPYTLSRLAEMVGQLLSE